MKPLKKSAVLHEDLCTQKCSKYVNISSVFSNKPSKRRANRSKRANQTAERLYHYNDIHSDRNTAACACAGLVDTTRYATSVVLVCYIVGIIWIKRRAEQAKASKQKAASKDFVWLEMNFWFIMTCVLSPFVCFQYTTGSNERLWCYSAVSYINYTIRVAWGSSNCASLRY